MDNLTPKDLQIRYEHLLAVRNEQPTYTYFPCSYNFEIGLIERIRELEEEVQGYKWADQVNQEEFEDICSSENIPPAQCCAPKYCALAPFSEIIRLRKVLLSKETNA